MRTRFAYSDLVNDKTVEIAIVEQGADVLKYCGADVSMYEEA